jgi:hypothetical protein
VRVRGRLGVALGGEVLDDTALEGSDQLALMPCKKGGGEGCECRRRGGQQGGVHGKKKTRIGRVKKGKDASLNDELIGIVHLTLLRSV